MVFFKFARVVGVPLTTRLNIITGVRLVPWKQIDHFIEALVEIDGAGLVVVGVVGKQPKDFDGRR